MKYLRHIIPLLAISLATVVIFQLFYINIEKNEEQRCWEDLKTAVDDLNKEMQIKFTDEISKLHLLRTIMLNDGAASAEDMAYLPIDKLLLGTMFTRIDLLYPDNTLLLNGQLCEVDADIDFERIEKKGEYLTNRKVDFLNGTPCVYYVLPMEYDGEILAVMIGVIDCVELQELFNPAIYNGKANVCLIDTKDGNYVMDNWHETLGNAYEMEQRELLEDYQDVDFTSEIRNQRAGAIAFVSATTGKDIYMYYAPSGIFDWQTAVFATDDVVFAKIASLREEFIVAVVVEIFLFFLYCAGNLYLIRRLQVTNREIEGKSERLEFLSYRDMLTSLYNRHKYFEVLSAYAKNPPVNMGVAYVDLNGLKQLNDSSSHEAGDRYLCTTAELLKENFGEGCYRIGGDEFVVLAAEMEKVEFCRRVEALRQSAARENISMAIGCRWSDECGDIHEMIGAAEKEMYAQKR